MREAEAGMRAEPSWRFRILKADVLLARSDTKGAKELLASAEPPSDPELLARLRMDQGWVEYLCSNYASAEALLHQAAGTAQPLGVPLLEATIESRIGVVETRQGRLDLRSTPSVTSSKSLRAARPLSSGLRHGQSRRAVPE